MDRFFSLFPPLRRSPCRTRLLLGTLLSILCLGIGCGDFTLFGEENSNRSPEAIASADKENATACQTDTVTLDGTGSTDPDGDTLTYQWEFTQRPAGSNAALQSDASSTASFQPDKAGEYDVKLTVTDPGGGSGTDSITVTAGSGPVADAGNDQSVSIGDTVTLNGDGSVNPEDDCTDNGLSFSWSLEDPNGDVSDLDIGPEPTEATFAADMEGTYTATLTVDNGVGTDEDVVQIQVGQAGGLLDSLEGGEYLFTVDTVTDGVFDGKLAALEGTTLDETVNIPSADSLSPPEERTISLNVALTPIGEAQLEIVFEIDRENAADDFYTLTGTQVSGAASAGSLSCELESADCIGELTPVTTTSVTVSLTISNLVLKGVCLGTNEEGTIDVTLNGDLQTTQ